MAKPDKCISVAKAKELHDNWVNTRGAAITSMLSGNQDCREFVYSVDDLQEYLDYVKTKAKENNVANPGVRIYFGAYNDVNSTKATMFMAATKGTTSTADNDYDVEPFNTITGGFPPKNY